MNLKHTPKPNDMKDLNDIFALIAKINNQNADYMAKYNVEYSAKFNWINCEQFHSLNGKVETLNTLFSHYVLNDNSDIQICYWTLNKLVR